ncbi:glycine dehydrogenase, partial [bacterium]|nr:glycine dehydrogenase [bacterium]
MKNFTAHTEETRKELLDVVGMSSVDELFAHLPIKMKTLDLDNGKSEMEVQKEVKKLAKKNNTDYVSFLGGGCYNKFIPAAISQVAQRVEFLTAYTPYQPEIS